MYALPERRDNVAPAVRYMGFQPMSCRAILAPRPGRGKPPLGQVPRRRTDKPPAGQVSVPRTTRTPYVRFFLPPVLCASVCRELLLLLFWNLRIGVCLELVSWNLGFADQAGSEK